MTSVSHVCRVTTNCLDFVARRQILLKLIAFGSSIAGREQIVDVPLPFVQEEFVESEALESFSQCTVSIMKDIGLQLPEDQREGEEIVIKNSFLQVVRNAVDGVQSRHRRFGGRPRAVSTPSVWKPVCGVGSPVHQLLGEMEVMILNPQERINESMVEVPVPHFREETVEVVEEPVLKGFSQDGVDQILDVPVPQMMEQLGQTEDSVSNRIQRRTAEQIVDMPFSQTLDHDVPRVPQIRRDGGDGE